MAEFRLKYIIDADGTKAKSELETVETKIARLGGASGLSATQLDALTVGAGAAAAAIAAVAAAAVTGAVALFNLTKKTAEYGSEIFDASEKTGLHAESLSAMKLAADQSGSSLEQVTSGIAKFSKTVGEAADGSKEAAAKLKALGIDPQEALADLDTALAKVFKQIVEAKPGIEQITLAQKAFGKSGADLLPFIKSFDGDLEKLVKRARELGITIDDEAARASDEFGDTLDTLSAQFDGLGRTIGTVFLPIFTDMAKALSEFLVANRENFESWASTAKQALLGLSQTFGAFEDRLEEFRSRTGKSWADLATDMLDKTGPLMIRMSQLQQLIGGAARGGVGYSSGLAREGGGVAGLPSVETPGTGGGSRRRGADPAREAERAEQERINTIRRNLNDELALRQATDAKIRESIELQLDREEISTEQAFDKIQQLVWDQMQFKIDAYEATLKAVQGNAEEEEKLNRELKVMWQEFHTLSLKQAREKIEFAKKADAEQERQFRAELDRQKQLMQVEQERLVLEQRRLDLLQEQQRTAPAPGYDANGEPNVQPGGAGYLESGDSAISRLYEELQNNAGAIAALDALTTAFQTLGQAVGQAVQAWVLYGKAGASVRQVTAQILAAVAQQAAVKAIFELAEGFAALALSFFGVPGAAAAATQHFIAAAIYGSIAGVAALAGRAVAGNSFNRESSSAGGGGSGGEAANNQNAPLVFTERFNGFQRQMTEMLDRTATVMGGMAEAVDGFTNKFSAVSPGHVVMAGAGDASREIREAFETELGTDLRAATNLFRQTGQYR